MSNSFEPNPPSRKDEDFPKTNTMPEGWVMDELMDVYNSAADDTKPAERAPTSTAPATTNVPTGGANGNSHPADAPSAADDNERLFTYRLEPYPTPGEQRGMYL